MTLTAKALTLLALTTVAGCTNSYGYPDQQATGVVVGGLTGAALGNAIGNDTGSTLAGGVIGAMVGGAIGANMAQQESELYRNLDGTGARITRNGNQLRVILPEDVTFATGSDVVNRSFRPALRRVAQSLRNHPDTEVRVVGHTDNVGSAAYNRELSRSRALSVANILVAEGVFYDRMSYSGRGYNEPIESNATAQGRAQNRRVEIIITPIN